MTLIFLTKFHPNLSIYFFIELKIKRQELKVDQEKVQTISNIIISIIIYLFILIIDNGDNLE